MGRRDIRRAFGPNAAAYGRTAPHAEIRALQDILATIGPVGRALDIATGGGHTAGAIAAVCPFVVALDFTPQMLRQAVAAYPGLVPVEADGLELPFDGETFDLVASRFAPHHFPSLDPFLSEATRVLRPGGCLYVLDCSARSDNVRLMDIIETLRDGSHGHNWTEAEWGEAVQRSRLHVQLSRLLSDRYELPSWYERLGTSEPARQEIRQLLESQSPRRIEYDLDGHHPYIEAFRFEGLFRK